MTQPTAEVTTFQAPPSENMVANVLASQPKALYLNKPKYHKEEDDTKVASAPAVAVTPTPGTPSTSEPSHDWAKRYSDLKSYHDKQTHSLQTDLAEKARLLNEREKQLELALKQPVKVPATPEELAEFTTKYGHLDKIVESKIILRNQETKNELVKLQKETEATVNAMQAEKAMQQLLELHPDAKELKKDPEFCSWVEKQIPAIKALINSSRVDEVACGIDIYKNLKGLVKSEAQKKAEIDAAAAYIPTNSAVEVGASTGKIWTASEVHKMSLNEYRVKEPEIIQAMREGRFREI